MQVENTRLYRVKSIAETLDVSVATIYRAVESGALRAVRVGTGKGAVRVPGQALVEYMAACERAAATSPTMARHVLHNPACTACGLDVGDPIVLPAELLAAIVAAAGLGASVSAESGVQDGRS